MNRITLTMLRNKVDQLNQLTGNPLEPYVTEEKGIRAAVGNYHLSGAYGGYALHRHANPSGGVCDIFGRGHMTKRELYDLLCAYMLGIEAGNNIQN